MNNINKIVLNIPHSSMYIPTNTWKGDIQKENEHWCDKFTDIIFAPHNNTSVVSVIFPYSRFFCDAERLFHDPMENIGQGIFYTNFGECIRKKDDMLYNSVMSIWTAHQNYLKREIVENTLIIDCHSFPSELAENIDFCIGFNEDESKPKQELIDLIANTIKGYGYNVAFNNPYSNSISPTLNRKRKYSSVMIEINKSIYLNSDGSKKGSMYKLNQMFNYLYKKILNIHG